MNLLPSLFIGMYDELKEVGTKKIDCLTTTNLDNLKSNTMKNTVQIYCFCMFYNIYSDEKVIVFNII